MNSIDAPNGIVRFYCPKCGGEGGYHVATGYRQYGGGYGDCEQTFEGRTCDECHGSGFYEVDYSPSSANRVREPTLPTEETLNMKYPYFQGDCSPLEYGGLWVIPHKNDGTFFVVRVQSWNDMIGDREAEQSFGKDAHDVQWGWVLPPDDRRLDEALKLFGVTLDEVDSPEMAIGLVVSVGGFNEEFNGETVNGEGATAHRIQDLLTFNDQVIAPEVIEGVREDMEDLVANYAD